MNFRLFLGIAAGIEIITGMLLAAFPLMGVNWLLGEAPGEVGQVVTRFAGIALMGLGMSCLPPDREEASAWIRPAIGLMIYHAFAAVYLGFTGANHDMMGKLFWFVVFFHGVFAVVIAFWLAGRGRNKVTADKYAEHLEES